MMRTERNRHTRPGLLPWLFLGAVYVLLVLFFARYGMHYLNGDVASDMVMAHHLNSEGRLITDTMWYTTELRILNVVNVYQLGFLLFPNNWHAVRLFAVIVLLAGTALSFIYMGRGFGLKEAAVWGAAVILLPTTIYYMFILTYGLCYACYVITTFIQLGLCVRIVYDKGKRSRLRFILLMALDVLSGLQGLRLLMLCAGPLGVTAFLILMRRAGECRDWKSLFRTDEGRLFILAAAHALAISAGTLVNMLYFAARYDYTANLYTLLKYFTADKLIAQADAVTCMLGSTGAEKAFSMQGMMTALAAALAVFLFISIILLVIRGRQSIPVRRYVLYLFTAISLVMGIFINTVFGCEGYYSPSYFITAYMLLCCSGFFLLEELPVRMPWVRTLCMAMAAGVFLLEGAGTLFGPKVARSITPREQAAQYLMETGCTEGFAGVWESAPLIAASDGQITTWQVLSFRWPEGVNPWAQPKRRAEEPPQGRAFLYDVMTMGEIYDLSARMGREPDWVVPSDGIEYGRPEGFPYFHVIYTADNWEQLLAPLQKR